MREQLEQLLRQAGELILSARDIEHKVSEKEGPANFVTTYDVAVQKLVRQRLMELCPDARFIGEEGDSQEGLGEGTAFIVDPIDGTTNFIKGCNASAISIAVMEHGQPVIGTIYDPYRDELFYAEKGKGATLNGKSIHVSDEGLAQSLICVGTTPYNPELHPWGIRLAQRLLEEGLDLRRSGSAVIDLCQVARGAVGLMFELRLCPWDHAAAGFIVAEAGGVVTQIDGTPVVYDRPCSAVAATPRAYVEFCQLGITKTCAEACGGCS